jgi:PPOX class probable F420-dependent enzyme
VTVDQQHLDVIAGHREAVLATIKADGRPQLSNVLYTWDPEARVARISTTAGRVKARNLARDPRGSLYVGGSHFWTYVVADADAELIGPTTVPGDEAGQELLQVHGAFYEELDEQTFFGQMIADQRLVIRLRIVHTYGLIMEKPPGG